MSDSLITAIANSSDLAWLRQCGDHNRRLGKLDIVKAVESRLRDLQLRNALMIRPDARTIEDRVYESLRVYRELLRHKHGRNQAAGYTERDIKQYGPREALIQTIRRGKRTDGLKLLAEHNRLDCAYEQIAIDHAQELPSDVVERARKTLAEYRGTT